MITKINEFKRFLDENLIKLNEAKIKKTISTYKVTKPFEIEDQNDGDKILKLKKDQEVKVVEYDEDNGLAFLNVGGKLYTTYDLLDMAQHLNGKKLNVSESVINEAKKRHIIAQYKMTKNHVAFGDNINTKKIKLKIGDIINIAKYDKDDDIIYFKINDVLYVAGVHTHDNFFKSAEWISGDRLHDVAAYKINKPAKIKPPYEVIAKSNGIALLDIRFNPTIVFENDIERLAANDFKDANLMNNYFTGTAIAGKGKSKSPKTVDYSSPFHTGQVIDNEKFEDAEEVDFKYDRRIGDEIITKLLNVYIKQNYIAGTKIIKLYLH